jgi:uncharacterized protein (UPF0548 family)
MREEALIVSRDDNEQVAFTVTAFSRPASWPAQAAGPVGRAIQNLITSRYLKACTP